MFVKITDEGISKEQVRPPRFYPVSRQPRVFHLGTLLPVCPRKSQPRIYSQLCFGQAEPCLRRHATEQQLPAPSPFTLPRPASRNSPVAFDVNMKGPAHLPHSSIDPNENQSYVASSGATISASQLTPLGLAPPSLPKEVSGSKWLPPSSTLRPANCHCLPSIPCVEAGWKRDRRALNTQVVGGPRPTSKRTTLDS